MQIFANNTPIPKNDPTLTELVPVTSLGGFCVGGRLIEAGTVVKLPRHTANDLIWQHKAELL
jgi:hypothetical protein